MSAHKVIAPIGAEVVAELEQIARDLSRISGKNVTAESVFGECLNIGMDSAQRYITNSGGTPRKSNVVPLRGAHVH